jgi:hypothetical protein
LGKTLPFSTFLVTNQVDFNTFFEQFEWSHPDWKVVRHSAIDRVVWGSTTSSAVLSYECQKMFQVWSDWYTLLQAERVYHTHSDFSLSAVHWNHQIESHSIQGVDGNGSLQLVDAPWRQGSNTVRPLVERTKDAMLHCDLQQSGLGGIGFVLDLDDEYHDDLLDDGRNHRRPKAG